MSRRFGLVDGVDTTLKEIASEFGITAERARQIETKALEKLGVILEKGGTRHVKDKHYLSFKIVLKK